MAHAVTLLPLPAAHACHRPFCFQVLLQPCLSLAKLCTSNSRRSKELCLSTCHPVCVRLAPSTWSPCPRSLAFVVSRLNRAFTKCGTVLCVLPSCCCALFFLCCVATETRHLDRLGPLAEFEHERNTDSPVHVWLQATHFHWDAPWDPHCLPAAAVATHAFPDPHCLPAAAVATHAFPDPRRCSIPPAASDTPLAAAGTFHCPSTGGTFRRLASHSPPAGAAPETAITRAGNDSEVKTYAEAAAPEKVTPRDGSGRKGDDCTAAAGSAVQLQVSRGDTFTVVTVVAAPPLACGSHAHSQASTLSRSVQESWVSSRLLTSQEVSCAWRAWQCEQPAQEQSTGECTPPKSFVLRATVDSACDLDCNAFADAALPRALGHARFELFDVFPAPLPPPALAWHHLGERDDVVSGLCVVTALFRKPASTEPPPPRGAAASANPAPAGCPPPTRTRAEALAARLAKGSDGRWQPMPAATAADDVPPHSVERRSAASTVMQCMSFVALLEPPEDCTRAVELRGGGSGSLEQRGRDTAAEQRNGGADRSLAAERRGNTDTQCSLPAAQREAVADRPMAVSRVGGAALHLTALCLLLPVENRSCVWCLCLLAICR